MDSKINILNNVCVVRAQTFVWRLILISKWTNSCGNPVCGSTGVGGTDVCQSSWESATYGDRAVCLVARHIKSVKQGLPRQVGAWSAV